jgi:hypothetical protein
MRNLFFITALLLVCQACWGNCFFGDCRNGYGAYTFADGAKYVGDFKNNKIHGQGTFTFPDGAKYVGDFKNNEMSGQGTVTWADGAKYVGDWKNSLKHGQGTETWADGSTKTGFWEKGTYFGTKAEWEEGEKKRDGIYNACLLDKSSDFDLKVRITRIAVQKTCMAIAKDPSWFEELKYN